MMRGSGISFSGVFILDEGLEVLSESLGLLIGIHHDRVAEAGEVGGSLGGL
jgi:hypothetical protein